MYSFSRFNKNYLLPKPTRKSRSRSTIRALRPRSRSRRNRSRRRHQPNYSTFSTQTQQQPTPILLNLESIQNNNSRQNNYLPFPLHNELPQNYIQTNQTLQNRSQTPTKIGLVIIPVKYLSLDQPYTMKIPQDFEIKPAEFMPSAFNRNLIVSLPVQLHNSTTESVEALVDLANKKLDYITINNQGNHINPISNYTTKNENTNNVDFIISMYDLTNVRNVNIIKDDGELIAFLTIKSIQTKNKYTNSISYKITPKALFFDKHYNLEYIKNIFIKFTNDIFPA